MPSVLSVQSRVAYGHVGNAAAVFPLQCLGIEAWALDTVAFFFRYRALALADIATPNRFELEYLTGSAIGSLGEAAEAVAQLRSRGPGIVLVTSLDAAPGGDAQRLRRRDRGAVPRSPAERRGFARCAGAHRRLDVRGDRDDGRDGTLRAGARRRARGTGAAEPGVFGAESLARHCARGRRQRGNLPPEGQGGRSNWVRHARGEMKRRAEGPHIHVRRSLEMSIPTQRPSSPHPIPFLQLLGETPATVREMKSVPQSSRSGKPPRLPKSLTRKGIHDFRFERCVVSTA